MSLKTLNHIAFIVDGNRRWARREGMPLYDAYKIAGKILVDNVCFAASQSIGCVTAFLFSTRYCQVWCMRGLGGML